VEEVYRLVVQRMQRALDELTAAWRWPLLG